MAYRSRGFSRHANLLPCGGRHVRFVPIAAIAGSCSVGHPERFTFAQPLRQMRIFSEILSSRALTCVKIVTVLFDIFSNAFACCTNSHKADRMAHKHILFRSAAREKILRGATQLTDVVRVTLGPRSKAVLIERSWGPPIVCNDGVTIAKEFDLKDPEENLGARMLRQAAEKTGDMVGDGTSTATILAHAMFADGVRNVVAGASAIDIKRGLYRAAKRASESA